MYNMGRDEYHFWSYLLTFLAMVAAGILLVRRKRSKKLLLAAVPPGPWKLPIIGNLHQLITHNRHLPPHQRLWELSNIYGPVMQLQLGEHRTILISSAEAAEQVMKTHDMVFASRPFSLASDILFYGRRDLFFAPYGEHWRQMRKLCVMELLTVRRVGSFRNVRVEEISNLVASISQSAAKGQQALDLKPLLLCLTTTITARSAVGKAPKLSQRFVAVAEKIVGSLGGFRLSDLFPSLKFIPLVTGFRSKLLAIHQAADSVLNEIINEHIVARRQRRTSSRRCDTDEAEEEDLVDVLLNLQENNDDLALPLTMDAVKAILLNIFLGGTDTTATTIEWTMAEMMKKPNVLRRVQKEVRSVFGEHVSEDGLHKLEYLNAVLNESLRLHPPVPILIPKETREQVEINGFEVPSDNQVMVNVWAIGRDPCYWTNPNEFDPERFLHSTINYKGTHFGFIPFGAGRRMCPGIQFGMTIVLLTLANLLFHFDWELPYGIKNEDLDMTEHFDAMLRKKQTLCLKPLVRRSSRLNGQRERRH